MTIVRILTLLEGDELHIGDGRFSFVQYNESPKFIGCWNIHEISIYTVYLLKMRKYEN
jgi:hypothetical protein